MFVLGRSGWPQGNEPRYTRPVRSASDQHNNDKRYDNLQLSFPANYVIGITPIMSYLIGITPRR